ncbi:hypothetical protein [Sutterella wadsworthensis]|uniref:hypothetical protein n=1 Tax=Sutterella wadsworthensis TaxID=40545 RepID=UPI001F0EF100|nr:hypothetical protein [Sutterella wadsworthensis]
MAAVSVLLTLAVANRISPIINQFIQGAQNLTSNLKVVLSRIVTVLFLILAVTIGLGTVGIDLTIPRVRDTFCSCSPEQRRRPLRPCRRHTWMGPDLQKSRPTQAGRLLNYLSL